MTVPKNECICASHLSIPELMVDSRAFILHQRLPTRDKEINRWCAHVQGLLVRPQNPRNSKSLKDIDIKKSSWILSSNPTSRSYLQESSIINIRESWIHKTWNLRTETQQSSYSIMLSLIIGPEMKRDI